MIVKPGDIFFCQSSSLLGKTIQFLSRGKYNHTGIFVFQNSLRWGRSIEALWNGVVSHSIWDYYSGRSVKIEIWRPLNISDRDRVKIAFEAYKDIGVGYGWFDLTAQFMDALIPFNPYIFRRLGKYGKESVCSNFVAKWYRSVGLSFGLELNQVQPDDLQRFCAATEGRYYEKVRKLSYLIDGDSDANAC